MARLSGWRVPLVARRWLRNWTLLQVALPDALGITWAMAALTFASGLIVLLRMYETLPSMRQIEQPDVVAERAAA